MAIKLDLTKLEDIEGRIREPVSLKLGIINSKKNGRKDDPFTNAEIGARHEFGLFVPELKKRLPKRSFLKMPMIVAFPAALKRMNWLEKQDFNDLVKGDSGLRFYKKIAMLGIKTIDVAFQTGGFGKWKPSNMAFKKVHMTLVETVQLRRSIWYRVDKK
jgi:hypothetical protein